MRQVLLIAIIFLVGCPDMGECYWNGYLDITDYEVTPNSISSDGIRVDDPLGELDLEDLDRRTRELETCLGITVQRECLIIKVASDWYISECSGQQLFPCDINDQVCIDKGVTPEDLERCPCNCRAMIQNENTIIVTPDLRLYKGELARMITGQNNPWINYSNCL